VRQDGKATTPERQAISLQNDPRTNNNQCSKDEITSKSSSKAEKPQMRQGWNLPKK
jgi:hypothetical protein